MWLGSRDFQIRTIILLITIGGCMCSIPVILGNPSHIIFPDGSQNGTVLFRFTGTHAKPGENISVRAVNIETANIVYVNQTYGNNITGQVITKTILDSDPNGLPPGKAAVELTFVASDIIGNQVNFSTTLYITDINDNKPVFENPHYSWNIKELPFLGNETFTNIRATDIDTNNFGTQGIRYRMEPNTQSNSTAADYNAHFRIDFQTAVVTLTKELDYSTNNYYQFDVSAQDDRGTGNTSVPADLIIRVLDVQNKPPFFISIPYRASIKENTNKNSHVLKVTARDGDTGIPNPITYTILPGVCSTLFSIDQEGHISTSKAIDRDKGDIAQVSGVCVLTILAKEVDLYPGDQHGPTNATANATITIEDENDNAPQFQNDTYTAEIQENTPRNVPITLIDPVEILVFDLDQDSNAIINLTLMYPNGSVCDDFIISPSIIRKSGSALIRVANKEILDYETIKQTDFLIVAKDVASTSLVATATVSLNIIDMNDNNPQFENSNYSFSIPENSLSDTFVGQITANDSDSGESGNVTYSISGGNNRFLVDQYNGRIATLCSNCQNELDREKIEVYFMTYTATDLGGRSNSTSLVVHLTDQNDNTPVFARPTYSAFIRENDQSYNSTALVQLEAFDADEPRKNNSEIRYQIKQVSPESIKINITINHTSGEMFLSHAVDYENLENADGIIQVTVEAMDLGSPSRASNASVHITVQDVNDNNPVFNSSTFYAKITENSTSNATNLTSVGRVFASDDDGTDPNNKSQFFITDGANNDFTVNSLTGEVSVQINRELDRETTPSYNVTIIAIDQGAPPLTGTTTLSIDIIDINDEFPVFNRTSYTVQVFENEHIGKIVIECPATDKDENSQLNYSVIKTEAKNELGHVVNYTLVEDYFSIYANNGSVFVNNPLNREIAKTIELTVQVTDTNAYYPFPQTSEAQLTITLLDVNDHHPEFEGLPYNISVSENAQDNTILLTIRATDKDEDRTINYTINRTSNESVSFGIDQITGVLTKIGPLDRETTSSITLNITATDNGVPPLSSSTEVFVTVLDFNDNDPQFVNFTDEISIPENHSINALVLQVTAHDGDIGPNANVTYQIEDGDDGKFKIDPISGRIEVLAGLDRETKPTFTLRIKAQDNPLNPKEQKSTSDVLTVRLIDINDNCPHFTDSWYSQSILENTEIGTLVIKVSAEDADEPGTNNSLISYSFSNNTSPPGLFKITQFSGDIIVNKSLIGDVTSYLIVLVAEDHGDPKRQNTSVVNITVLDVNLNKPVISNLPSNGSIKVYECVEPGYDIYHFKYSDDDNGINAQADFNISEIDDSIFETFEIKAKGTLKIIQKLDAKAKDSYRFQVQVTDRGVPPLSSDKMTITVKVIDVDDQLPSFSEDKITFRVKENQAAGAEIGTVYAEDPDQDSVSCYDIVDNEMAKVFAIGLNNGSIVTKMELDYEKRTTFSFTVNVTDCSIAVNISECGNITHKNQNDYRNSINVTVNVIDVNDNAPVFEVDEITVGMRRVTEVNTTLDISLKTSDYIEDKDTDINGKHAWVFSNAGDIKTSSSLSGKLSPLGGVMKCNSDKKHHIVCVSGNGSLINNKYYSEDISGYFVLPVNVSDAAGSDTVRIKIFLIADSQILIMTVLGNKEEIAETKNGILKIYSRVTGYEFVYDWLEDHKTPDGKVETYKTDLYFHVVDRKTDRVLSVSEALRIVDGNYEALLQAMQQFSVLQVISSVKEPPEEDSSVKTVYILAAVIAILALTVAIVIYVSLITRNTYKRKLKAATVKPQDIHDVSEKNKTVVPGSNMYSRQANPLLHAEIPEKIVYDNISMGSQNSLDSNSVGDPRQEGDQMEEKEVRMDMFTEDTDYSTIPEDPLEAALKHYDMQNMQNKQDSNSTDAFVSPHDIDSLQFENKAYVGEFESTEI